MPKFHQLKFLKNGNQKIQIIEEVAASWTDLAYALEMDDSLVTIIKADSKHDSVVKACEEMFRCWLDGKGCKDVTWKRLIEALTDIHHSVLAENVEQLLLAS